MIHSLFLQQSVVKKEVNVVDKIDDYIQQKLTQKIEEYIRDALNRGLTKKEIRSYLLYKGHDKKMVEKMLSQVKEKKHTFFQFKKEKKFTLKEKKKYAFSKRFVLFISILVIFIVLMATAALIKQPKSGNGTCPYVSDSDVRKVATLHFEKNTGLSYLEMDELVGAYLGKEDCSIIDKSTIKKLRKIKLD